MVALKSFVINLSRWKNLLKKRNFHEKIEKLVKVLWEEITLIREKNIAKLERKRKLSDKQTTSLCSHANIADTAAFKNKLLIKIPYEDNQQRQVIVRIIQISQAMKKTLPPKIKIHEIFHILTQIKKTTKQLKKILHQRFKK